MKKFLLLIAAILLIGGCSMARSPAGDIIIGWKVGQIVESVDEGLAAVANTFVPGLGTLVIGALTATGGVTGAVAAVGATLRRRAAERVAEEMERKRRKADQARELAAIDAAVLAAKLEKAENSV